MSNLKKYTFYFGVLLLVLSLNSCTADDDSIEETTATGSITVEEQIVHQNILVVKNVEIDTDAWLVVRKLNGYANYSGILAEPVFIEKGSTNDIRVELGNEEARGDWRMHIGDGTNLILMLHQDDGDGVFEFEDNSGADKLIKDANSIHFGGNLSESVKIHRPGFIVEDQIVENRTVLIDTVSTKENGWIVLHDSNEDESINESEILGHTYVTAGDNIGVEVVLDEDFDYTAGHVLYSRLYRDDPADEQFTFKENQEEDLPMIFGFGDNNTITGSFIID